MRSPSGLSLAAMFALATFASCNCQRKTAVETPIAELQSCPQDDRCETGLCDTVPNADGGLICLRPCAQGCRGADVCTLLPNGRYACVPERAGLCKACQQDSDCPRPADKCIVLGDTSFCGRDCSFDDSCPSSFRCAEATTVAGTLAPKQCQPTSGTCDCIAATAGQQRPCMVSNNFGTCSGVEVCTPPDGYSACNARTPASEVCNGLDDDCNGQVDEDLGDITCGVGECQRAASACANGAPQSCLPGQPVTETCNGRDDDCDGTVDNGFDLQNDPSHCGSCSTVCALTNAVPGCASGACTVDHCAPGWSNLDGIAANGCEYPCTPTDGGVEVCDGLDNDCNGLVDDGYDLRTDPTNCGQCGLVCSLPQGTVDTYACVARVCGIATCVAGRGDCNQQYGDGCEVDLGTSLDHCGACGASCSAPHASTACQAGTCGITACASGFANCNGQLGDGCEVNTQTDLANCGACGTVCSAANATSTCAAGSCAFTCAANWWDADGQASNGCEYACVRTNGGVEQCDGIDNDCDNHVDEDFDLQSDVNHCGSCSRACSAPFATSACSASSCGITACNPGRANCNGVYADGCEVNTQSDLANCGACGTSCSAANGTSTCVAGACGLGSCNQGFANCNGQLGDGCEVNTTTSTANCGGCGQACAPAHAAGQCLNGTCAIGTCNTGYLDLNGSAADGCEYQCSPTNGGVEACDGLDNNCNGTIDEGFAVQSDVNNCGACGHVCSGPQVAASSCTAGQCGVVACAAGYANCDGAYANGCEVNTGTSVGNCGACGNVCSTTNGTPACVAGSCGVGACSSGFGDCNHLPGDGCEVNTNTAVSNCGACGNACTAANGTPACSNGSCAVSACNAGYANCNNQVSDGCEVNTRTDLANCGACGQACAPAHAVGFCSNATCGVASCLPGFWNLDGNAANGCEYACTVSNGGVEACDGLDNDCDGAVDEDFNVQGDVNNCGSCGHVCSAANVSVSRCTAGACGVQTCAGTTADCNGSYADGCEVNTATSLSNCGGCGSVCTTANASPACLGGTCQVQSCNPGYGNCNANPADGCEVNLTGNVDACGLCGNVCPARSHAGRTCSGTTCGYACNAGYVDLDGNAANGCEYQCTAIGNDEPDDASQDADCDGIDGTASKALFVSLTGNDANPGTRAAPKRTVQAAINAASSSQPHVYVSTGTYDEAVSLRSGISVYGGYDPTTWARSASNVVTVRNGLIGSGRVVAVTATGISAATTLAYVTVQAVGTSSPGVSVYGMYCNACNALTIRSALIIGGGGGQGASGSNGSAGSSGGNGVGGTNGTCDNNIAGAAGGPGGTSACGRTGGVGGQGGDYGSNAGRPGGTGVVGTPGGPGGAGGGTGRPGTVGGTGAGGAIGSFGGAGSGGSVVGGFFVTFAGGGGGAGAHGNGGGGGGGGGGQGGLTHNDGNGNGGGGGGAGGCAGGGATGGSGGGSSFGLFLVNSTGIVLLGNSITSSNGGSGGAGGTGGPGGSGGSGGPGATFCTGEIGAGGNGGPGGNGGSGGHGGGGEGGWSYAVFRSGTSVTTIGNTLTSGTPGLGGFSLGNQGANGQAGAVY